MKHYVRLAAMTVLSFIAMYGLMYAMVARFPDVYANQNQAYMAALMTAPMVLIELMLMRGMYQNTAANTAIAVASLIVLGTSWSAIRSQTGIGDVEFLRSMIPHHSGAILMCREASLADPEIRDLCSTIMAGQQSEIERMNSMLARLSGG